MRFKSALAFGFTAAALTACSVSTSDTSDTRTQPTFTTTNGPVSGEAEGVSLKSQLDAGQTLVVTLDDTKLASDINDHMNSRDLVYIQDGKETFEPADMKPYCQIGSKDGFVRLGDQFNLSTAQVEDRIYLAARRVHLSVSAYLGLECYKGGMDQTAMTLGDLQQILGSLVRLRLID